LEQYRTVQWIEKRSRMSADLEDREGIGLKLITDVFCRRLLSGEVSLPSVDVDELTAGEERSPGVGLRNIGDGSPHR
jgi:hypothetical protein